MNRQLANIDPEAVAEKIAKQIPINRKELAVHTRYAYSTVREWDWLPELAGRIFWEDFVIARRRVTGLEPDPRIVSRRQRSNADKSGKSLSRHD